jgi:hypothetical protein
MRISRKIGWHICHFQHETGIVSLVSSTTSLDLSPLEAYNLLHFLAIVQEPLRLKASAEKREGDGR